MKHLVGVITFRMTKMLKITVETLSNEIDFVLHVDSKTNLTEYSEIESSVSFIENRIDVQWGDYSQILSMLSIIKYANEHHYDYVSIISETDLPLRNGQEINSFLSKHKKEFIGYVPNSRAVAEERLKYNYFSFYKQRGNVLRKVFKELKLYRFFKNPYFSQLPDLYKGSNWFTISSDAVSVILEYLDTNPEYLEAYKKSYCADEVFFQTILLNSELKENIYGLGSNLDDNEMSLRYVDWETGPTFPTILQAEKVDEYKRRNPNAFFFRKVNDKSDFDTYLEKLRGDNYEV